jgi:hypothetical protein
MANPGFASYSTSVNDLHLARTARLAEAKALFDAGHYAGVILAGHFAVEIAIKLYICRTRNVEYLQQPYQTHDLRQLLHAAGLFDDAIHRKRVPMGSGGESIKSDSGTRIHSVMENWKFVLKFQERDITELRYTDPGKISKLTAKRHIDATALAPNGVACWLDRQ